MRSRPRWLGDHRACFEACALGTTSLYGVGSSQYNRIKIPAERLGAMREDVIRYAELGRSEAFGTSQYSEETVDALESTLCSSPTRSVEQHFR